MTVMYSFCLWFPLRFGAVACGLSAAAQSLACIIACIVGDSDRSKTSKVVNEWLKYNEFLLATSIMKKLTDDPATVLGWFIAVFAIHLITCAFLIVGVYRCSLWLIYPFVGLDFVRMVTFSALFILLILIIKVNTNTLGYVISCSIGGGFILLYLWYQWFCVVSLCQIIRHVGKMDKSSRISFPVVSKTAQGGLSTSKLPMSINLDRINNVTLYNKKTHFYGLPNVSQ